jgi:heme/copper-type cytochrome/quinol oxidase subunit 2
MTLDPVGTIIIAILGFLAFAVFLVGIAFAMWQVVRDQSIGNLVKTIWVIVLLAAPVLGLVTWFIFGFRRSAENRTSRQ